MAQILTGLLIIFLIICSGLDVHSRKLPFFLLLSAAVLGTVLELMEHGIGSGLFWNLIPGAALLALSLLVPGQLGTGDGWMLIAAGALKGWETGLLLLEGGLLLMFPVAFFWTVLRRKRDRELPFAPFMLTAYLCGKFLF